MENRQVVQHFCGKPVRFYKKTFQVKIDSQLSFSLQNNICLDTYAVPLSDFCDATSCDESLVKKLIASLAPTFLDLCIAKPIPDKRGCLKPGIIMAREMVDALMLNLFTISGTSQVCKAKLIKFFPWIIQVIDLIRKGKLKFVRNQLGEFKKLPSAYRDLLSLQSSRELASRVKLQAGIEGVRPETIYRRLREIRGGSVITKNGIPRKTRRVK